MLDNCLCALDRSERYLEFTFYLVDNPGASETMDKFFGSRDSEVLFLKPILRLNHHRTLRHAGPIKSYIYMYKYVFIILSFS